MDFWDKLVQEIITRSEETGVGDSKDRLETLTSNFHLPVQPDHIEEFDGLNHEEARRFVFVISLPIIMRAHAIQLKISQDLLHVRVPNLYNLALGLPLACHNSESSATAYFEFTLRKLIVVIRVKRPEDDKADDEEDNQKKTVVVEVVDTKRLEGNDMLFDIV